MKNIFCKTLSLRILRHIELIIQSFLRQKLVMCPCFHDLTVVYIHNTVAVPDRGQTVGDQE